MEPRVNMSGFEFIQTGYRENFTDGKTSPVLVQDQRFPLFLSCQQHFRGFCQIAPLCARLSMPATTAKTPYDLTSCTNPPHASTPLPGVPAPPR